LVILKLVAYFMRLVRGLINLPEEATPCALTIGNFDGVHRGHQQIIWSLAVAAEKRNLLSSLMLFEPQPMEFFLGEKAPARLYRFADKLRMLTELPLNRVIVLDFNGYLAEMYAEDFIRHILVRRLNMKYLLVGNDFRFGKNRAGDLEILTAAANRYDFELHDIDDVLDAECRVSSTAVRGLLYRGDIEAANRLLGRPYTMYGRVVHGQKLGRDIGWPTINIPVRRRHSPVSGVYAVHVSGVEDNVILDGVASIGTRPTVSGVDWMLEVFLFDWSGDCYGQRVGVEFVRYLRDEEKFENLQAMALQIERDAQFAREVLSK